MKRRLLILFLVVQLAEGHFDATECDKTKKCIFSPAGCQQEKSKCQHMLSYSADEDGWVDLMISSTNNEPNDNYIALGFSEDDEMGNEPVTQCVFPKDGKPTAHFSFNVGKSNNPVTDPSDVEAEKKNLKLLHAHKGDDGMYCHLRQRSNTIGSQFVPDLNRTLYVFIAKGLAGDPRAIGIHGLDPKLPTFPYIHPQPVNLVEVVKREAAHPPEAVHPPPAKKAPANDTPSSSSSSSSSSLPVNEAPFLDRQAKYWVIRVHGMLMVFAWIVLVGSAILSARYLRDHFPSSAPFGLKWWFHIHRTLNLTALLLVLLSTLLIFIAKDWTWRGPSVNNSSTDNFSPGSIHSLLGTIAVLILIVQPLLALMRCQPDTGARPIFNWTHRSLGITGIFLAIIAILIATNSFVSLWGDANWSFGVVIFYIVILILAVVLFELLTYMKNKAPNKAAAMEMRNRSAHRYDDSGRVISSPPKVINTKSLWGILALYVAFVLFSICVAALLIVMLSV